MFKFKGALVLAICVAAVPCLAAGTGRGKTESQRGGENRPGRVTICHHGDDEGIWKAITVSDRALPAHLRHGDCQIDDGVGCTTDSCDAELGCVHEADHGACDDGDACTTDACDAATGTCSYLDVVCDDGDACTADSCDPATGCANVAVSCDDGIACTTDSCDPATGCVYTPVTCGDCEECENGECVSAGECVEDSDCGVGESCVDCTCVPE